MRLQASKISSTYPLLAADEVTHMVDGHGGQRRNVRADFHGQEAMALSLRLKLGGELGSSHLLLNHLVGHSLAKLERYFNYRIETRK